MTTLCIVDMQKKFKKNSDKCIDGVLLEIKRARKRNAGIVILEYVDCGETDKRIKEALKNYDKVAYRTKSDDNGGPELLDAISKRHFSRNVRICGVNRTYCVFETTFHCVKSRSIESVEVAIDATWCNAPVRGRNWLKNIFKFV